jgi:segregation and condensation protein B
MEQLEKLPIWVEALIFASETPLRIDDIQVCLESFLHFVVPHRHIQKAIISLKEKYATDDFSFELVEIANGFQFLTKSVFQNLLGTWLRQRSNRKLTKSTLETLALIAYQQPISKSELEHVRGVSCDYAVQKLLEKELIELRGRSEEAGRALLYGTTPKFMQHFGINSIKDLPKLKEFKTEDNQIGEVSE